MKDIDRLLEKYYEGETSLEEEKQLREFFGGDSIPPHLQSPAATFRYLAEVRREKAPARLSDWPSAPIRPGRRLLVYWGWRVAAGVGLVLLGFGGGLRYQRTAPSLTQTIRADGLAMQKALRFDRARLTSASERIRAVNQSYQLAQADDEITRVLINTMNFDDNVNVRLAACEALYRFHEESAVREAFVQSLRIQTDPNVQALLIDILVEIKEKRAVEAMQKLIQDPSVMRAVRLKAEQGIGRLI
ncbi:MAG: HEAT repeat domain-containing protein [Ferruginibacter sp.]|nr:HEAT repeat domain-containing protein [Cytophagales bacterium]